MSKSNLDRFYPRCVYCDGKLSYFEIYDCLDHRVLGMSFDWFDALHRCYALRDSFQLKNPVQLSIPFDY